MSSTSSNTYQINLNITTTTAVLSSSYRTSTTSTTHILPSTYPSIPHANAAVQPDVKAWAAGQPQHLRMKMHSFTEEGTWEFESMGKNEAEEVSVEAVIRGVDDDDSELTELDENVIDMGEDGRDAEEKRKSPSSAKDKKGKTREKGGSEESVRSRQLPIRSRSSAEKSRVEDNMADGGRVSRKMPNRRIKGKDVNEGGKG